MISRTRFFTSFLVLGLTVAYVHSQGCGTDDSVEITQRRIESIRRKIMSQLGLTEQMVALNNSVSRKPINASELADFYAINNASLKMEEETKNERHDFAQIISTIKVTMSEDNMKIGSSEVVGSFRLDFNLDFSEGIKNLNKAELLLYQVPQVPTKRVTEQYVEIRRINGPSGEKYSIITGKYLDIDSSGYQVFDITRLLKKWAAHHGPGDSKKFSLQVLVYCFDCSKSKLGGIAKPAPKIEFFGAEQDLDLVGEQAPKVMLVSKNPLEMQSSRKKRAVGSICSEPVPASSLCCRRQLTLNFEEDLKLYNIDHPRSIDVNVCSGDCITWESGSLYQEIYSKFVGTTPAPCCVPHSLSDVELHITGGAFRKLEDVIINSCRCA